ncbi:ATP-binding protein [Inhella gelatinilytica]|uniref:ATP-binding protein n=1 Tax=Inhella gelatinilytica TaxID=2795030 RepID=A0A931IW67_9BURK|nr:ATP-binding protein [Inhella gelatinilytica]MBH9553269.1 ATP-binding protein [Inhella gelatinilytica]
MDSNVGGDVTSPTDLLARCVALLERLDARYQGGVVQPDWQGARAWRLRRQGLSVHLHPVRQLSAQRFETLLEIDAQKARFQRNLAAFVEGRPANHVLLSGARGCGKSSLVKAALNAWPDLRLIEIDKADLGELPVLSEVLATRPEKFLLFCDDLSFEAGESGYKALKSVLDGTVAAGGDNLLLVATSNRRHLMPEQFKDNLETRGRGPDGEIHPGESVEEKISLSERFGLWISFYPFSQEEYLRLCELWLMEHGLQPTEALRAQARVWALERGSRSGRVAHQFARDVAGRNDA